jgi:hypothetical protein
MSTPRNRDLARGFQHAKRLLDEEADRLAAMNDDEFERAMESEPAPGRVPTVAELMDRAERRRLGQGPDGGPRGAASSGEASPPRPAPRARVPARWVAMTAAVAIAALLALVVWKRGPARITPDDGPFDPLRVSQRAEALREDALRACAAHDFTRCEAQLDEARSLEPDGEAAPEVAEARREIASAERPDGAVPALRREEKIPQDTRRSP